jgi:putative glutamine amidotransferase
VSDRADRPGRPPTVGLTTYVEQARWGPWDTPVALLTRTYLDAVARAGAVPVLLPPVVPGGDVDAAAGVAVDGLDGLIVSGGGDVDPARYGATPHSETAELRRERDAWELAVLRAATGARTPLLAICRGAQLLNVAAGGTLHQHVPDVVRNTDHRPAPGTFGRVRVDVVPGTRLAGIVGAALDVPCAHHQAIDRVGAGLRVSARAPDGTVEAVEPVGPDTDSDGPRNGGDGDPFVLGIQWHPEEDGEDLRLFSALVAAARDRTGEGAGRR